MTLPAYWERMNQRERLLAVVVAGVRPDLDDERRAV